MNKRQKLILLLAGVGLVVMVLFPPFFGADLESGGRVHAFLGYYPFWSPPSPEQVYLKLTSQDPSNVDAQRLAAFVPRRNIVRMVVNLVGLVAVCGVAFWLERSKGKNA